MALEPDAGLCARISPKRCADLSSHRRGIRLWSLSSTASPIVCFSRALEELREGEMMVLPRGCFSVAE